MGFYLWLDGDLAWAQGTYEYRPMGAAVISASDLFRRRDFDVHRKAPKSQPVGQYASLGQLNQELRMTRGKARQYRRDAETAAKNPSAR